MVVGIVILDLLKGLRVGAELGIYSVHQAREGGAGPRIADARPSLPPTPAAARAGRGQAGAGPRVKGR
jgi:hypothetical protein